MRPTTPEQAIASLLAYATVTEVQANPPRVKVCVGEILSDWVRWFFTFSGECIDWSAPSVGEQGMLLSPNGDMNCGSFLRGITSDNNPPPSNSLTSHKIKFKNGDTIEHTPDGYVINLAGDATIAAVTTTIDGDAVITGKLDVTGDITSAGKITDSDGNNGA